MPFKFLVGFVQNGMAGNDSLIQAKIVEFDRPIVTEEDYYALCQKATPERERTYVKIFSIQQLPIGTAPVTGLTAV